MFPIIEPEYLLLLASGLWVFCGLISGLKAPPLIRVEAGLLFVVLGVAGSGVGLAVFLPGGQSGLVLTASLVAFAVIPVVATVYLLWLFPDQITRRQYRRVNQD